MLKEFFDWISTLFRKAFQLWHGQTLKAQEEKCKEELAEQHRNNLVLRKVFESWHVWALDHAQTVSVQEAKVEIVQNHLNASRLYDAWLTWKERFNEEQLFRQKGEVAIKFQKLKIMNTMFHSWKLFSDEQIYKQCLRDRATKFDSVKLVASSLLRWKEVHSQALETNQLTTVALWHWSLTSQKKAMVAWNEYVHEQRFKNKQEKCSMLAYRSNLLKKGVIQWLDASTSLTALRQSYAEHQKTLEYFRKQCLAGRYLSKWYEITLARKKQRQATQEKETDAVSRNKGPIANGLGVSTVDEPRLALKLLHGPVPSHSPPRSKGISPSLDQVFANVPPHDGAALRVQPRRPEFLIQSLQREGLLSVADSIPVAAAQPLLSLPKNTESQLQPVVKAAVSNSSYPQHDLGTTLDLQHHFKPINTGQVDCVSLMPPDAFLRKPDGTPIAASVPGDLDHTRCAHSVITEASPSHVPTPTSADELKAIQEKFLAYKEVRNKLRRAQKHLKVIQDWLQHAQANNLPEEETADAKIEADLLVNEVEELAETVQKDKPMVQQMRARVESLVQLADLVDTSS